MSESSKDSMWLRSCPLARVVASSIKVSEAAGNVIKTVISGGDLGVVEKGSESAPDPQTEADRAAQYIIVKSLQHKFQEMTIIGEEEKMSTVDHLELDFDTEPLSLSYSNELSSLKEEDFVVWVDPLDGTSEIAKVKGTPSLGKPVGGVVHQPFYGPEGKGRTLWAVKGHELRPKKSVEKRGERVVLTTRSHATPTVENALQELKNRSLLHETVRVSGAGYKVLRLLDDCAAYVFASAGCKKWDTAAPQAILEAAGGTLTDISGRELHYSADVQKLNSGGVLATAPWVSHKEYVDAIPDALKQTLPEIAAKK